MDAEMIRKFRELSNPFEELTERQLKKNFQAYYVMIILLFLMNPELLTE